MSIRIVVGINWGDEGKGRMIDYFAKDADYVVRYQGGNNAGHTVVNEYGKFRLHLIPSGIFYDNVINILGPGTVVNLEALLSEINVLRNHGITIDEKNYKISNRAIICFPFHRLQDEYEEERLGNKLFGSTKQGIAPVYSDKYLKYGIQIGSLLYPEYLKEQIERCLSLKNQIFKAVYNKPSVSVNEMYEWALKYGGQLKHHIEDTILLFENAMKTGKNTLMEAQLGALRDVHYGVYPYTTSSCSLSTFAPIGSGCFSSLLPAVTGVMKAFSTCVGEGPFVTEMKSEIADSLREIAHEYGAATGRPRRIGHFDAVASRYGVITQRANEIALTKLDCLSGQKTLKICTHYLIGKSKTSVFPITAELVQASPVYIEMPGWNEDITEIRDFHKLPSNAKAYIDTIEKLIECPIKYISVGASREAIIVR
jgi:adenylosuccinate synthase